ncbi:MAG: iron donor protein CyaY [Acidobacteriota bacterium]
MLDDHQFQSRSQEALDDLFERLNAAAETHEFEADFNGGALTVEFEEPPTKFVVSPNSPVKQVWVSAHLKSYKLDWDEAREEFVLAATGQSLNDMMAEAVTKQIGSPVTL